MIVKPGIWKIAMGRNKEINEDKRSRLNLVLLHQIYLVKKIQTGKSQQWAGWLTEHVGVQDQIQAWYKQAAQKIQHQSRVNEFQMSEQTRIYHHEIHQKLMKRS